MQYPPLPHFISQVVENGNICLSGAYIDLHGVVPAPASAMDPSVSFSLPPFQLDLSLFLCVPLIITQLPLQSLLSANIFEQMKKRVSANPESAAKVNAIYAFNIKKNGKLAGTWSMPLCLFL